jgi:hypothetical protein
MALKVSDNNGETFPKFGRRQKSIPEYRPSSRIVDN